MDKDQPKDLKMKGKTVIRQEQDPDEVKNLLMQRNLELEKKDYNSRFAKPSQQLKITTVSPEKPTDFHSSKRAGKRPLEPVIDDPLKLVKKIVSIYGHYIDHIIALVEDRFRDENRWNFDSVMCEGLANDFIQKFRELKGIKKDSSYLSVREIAKHLENVHEFFERSENIKACTMPNCTKQQLGSCHDELQHIKKQLLEISSGIHQLKISKGMESKHKNLRI